MSYITTGDEIINACLEYHEKRWNKILESEGGTQMSELVKEWREPRVRSMFATSKDLYDEMQAIGDKMADLIEKQDRLLGVAIGALTKIAEHHTTQNNKVGRPLERSYTLRTANDALNQIKQEETL